MICRYLRQYFSIGYRNNALTETIIGLFKTEVLNRLGPWRSKDQIESETLQWVD